MAGTSLLWRASHAGTEWKKEAERCTLRRAMKRGEHYEAGR
jgi:hypothetical protein